MKTCRRCKSEKTLESFPRDKTKPDGRGSWCKACKEWQRDQAKQNTNVDAGRVCAKCHVEYDASSFIRVPGNKSGLGSYCSRCRLKPKKPAKLKPFVPFQPFELMPGETVKPIPSWFGHSATSLGRIIKHYRKRDEVMKCSVTKEGYIVAGGRMVHRLVLMAFNDWDEFPGPETRHLDGNKQNNRIENLAVGTSQENTEDKIRHGTIRRSLTAEQAREMRELSSQGVANKTLMTRFGVGAKVVSSIVRGRAYRDAGGPIQGHRGRLGWNDRRKKRRDVFP